MNVLFLEKSSLLRFLSYFFLAATFLLFPIAQIGIFDLPIYLSEAALFLAIVFFVSERGFTESIRSMRIIFREERLICLLVLLFLLGITASLLSNSHEFSAFGRWKSFYVVPMALFFFFLSLREAAVFQTILGSWFLGSSSAALASLIAAGEGIFLYDGRLAGLYQSANYLALLVAPALLMAPVVLSFVSSRSAKFGVFVLSALLLTALFLTRSYAAWGGLLIGALTFFMLFYRRNISGRRAITFTAAILLLLAMFFLFESGQAKLDQLIHFDERSSLASRLMIWEAAIDIALDHPFFGIGTSRFQSLYLEYQPLYPPYLEWAVPTPHNIFLHFWLEGGILVLLAWIGLVALVLSRIVSFWRTSRENGGRESVALFASIAALNIFYLVYGLIDTPYMKNDLVLAVWGALALLFAAWPKERATRA